MPDLSQSLAGRDLGHLRIIAELWSLDFDAPDAHVGLARLAPRLLDRDLIAELTGELPPAARAALDDLLQHDGRLPWALFTRRYGLVREVGPARRDRERPYRKGPSPAELLWYRALVARAFFETPGGPEEFAYIPDDLLPLLPATLNAAAPPLGRPATPAERAQPIPVSDRLLDHACTLLAALRLGLPLAEVDAFFPAASPRPAPPLPVLQALLAAAGLLAPDGQPLPEPTRTFLEAPRAEALAQLVRAWLPSPDFDELRRLPGLLCEGEWTSDPRRARQAILDFLSTLPTKPDQAAGKFWSLPAFIADLRQRHPDFQRPAGDYDSWFIRDVATGEFLRGFASWEAVDGALVRYLITGPLHWLGLLDLASAAPDGPITAFRFSPWAADLLRGVAPQGLPAETATLKASSAARLLAPRLAPRSLRYQLARFSAWEKADPDTYTYRLTPASLGRARQQGLTLAHLLPLLRRHTDALPPTLVRALERWEQHGSEARLENVLVLRLATPELLQQVRASKAARFLGDPLGPTTVLVHPGAAEQLLTLLAELGYLGELK
jgi:hypothetical protein